jgi:PAS domain S-box-containing protein
MMSEGAIQRLSGSENRYRLLFERSKDGILIVTPGGAIVDANPAWLGMFGYSREEFSKLNSVDLYANPSERAQFLSRMTEAGFVRDEVLYRRKDGSTFVGERTSAAVKNESGAVVAYQTIARDVTERSQAARALRDSEQKYRSLFEQSMDAICLASPGGHILEANKAYLDLFGYSRDDLATLNVEDQYVDSDRRTRFLEWMATHDTLVNDDVQFRRRDGTTMDCLHSAVARRGEDGGVLGYQSSIRDVTEMRRARESERQQHMFAERLMETSPACVLTFDAGSKVISANPETERVLGLAREDVLGMTAGKELAWLDASGNPLQDEPIRSVLSSGLPIYGIECTVQLPAGRRILSVSAAPLFSGDDSVTGVVATVEDITERKQMEEDIRRSYDTQAAIDAILKVSLEDLSLEQILERSLDAILAIPWLAFESRGCVFLVEDEPGVLRMKAQRGLAPPIQEACSRLQFGRCLCGRAAQTGGTQYAEGLDPRHEITYEGITHHGHYCVPIVSAGEVLGVVNVYVREGHRRDKREEEFLDAAANTLAGVIERKKRESEKERLLERLQKALAATIEAMSAAVDARDPYTSGHQRRVALIADAIAGEMGAGDEVRQAVSMAGQVHDLGKLQIPAEILAKPGRLSPIEFELIKCHSQASYDILKNIDFPWPVADIALQHHERLDGSGYPQGLKGNEMRLEARILAVADVFEAMSSHRPYRAAPGAEAALEELQRNRGKLFDPDAVDACVRLVRDRGFTPA